MRPGNGDTTPTCAPPHRDRPDPSAGCAGLRHGRQYRTLSAVLNRLSKSSTRAAWDKVVSQYGSALDTSLEHACTRSVATGRDDGARKIPPLHIAAARPHIPASWAPRCRSTPQTRHTPQSRTRGPKLAIAQPWLLFGGEGELASEVCACALSTHGLTAADIFIRHLARAVKGTDSKSVMFACVGSSPAGVVFLPRFARLRHGRLRVQHATIPAQSQTPSDVGVAQPVAHRGDRLHMASQRCWNYSTIP